jgi:hypothetical protein
MNHSVANDPSQGTGSRVTEISGTRAPSLRLAWAITIGEAILWGALACVFADYWLMLPLRYRCWGILVLASLAVIGFIRLVRFYRRSLRLNKIRLENRTPDPRSK